MTITFPRNLPDVPIKASRFGLNVNQSIFASDISRKVQVQQHAGGVTDRWEGVFTTARLSVAELAELTAFLVSLRGVEGSFLLGDPDRKSPRSGTLGNLARANSLDEASSTASIFHFIFGNRPLHLFGLKVGDKVSVTAQCHSGGSDNIRVILAYRDENGGFISEKDGNNVQSASYGASSFTNATIPANTKTLELFAANTETTETGFIKDIIMSRGATNSAVIAAVMGGSQTGRTLTVDRLPADTNRIFLAGDYFQLEGVIYMLLADVDSNGSGQATLDFEPALRTAPADNAQLLFENTTLTARLLTNIAAWETDHLRTGEISFAWEEVL